MRKWVVLFVKHHKVCWPQKSAAANKFFATPKNPCITKFKQYFFEIRDTRRGVRRNNIIGPDTSLLLLYLSNFIWILSLQNNIKLDAYFKPHFNKNKFKGKIKIKSCKNMVNE